MTEMMLLSVLTGICLVAAVAAIAALIKAGALSKQLDEFRKSDQNTTAMLQAFGELISRNQRDSAENMDRRLADINTRFSQMALENNRQLEEMRKTVDEKLQKTLDERITQSFKLVNDRLEQVYKGLGEMQNLAVGVGDLKKVLSNVKTRGILGEVQLGAILEQILAPEQYAENVITKSTGADRVEFAVKLPGDDERTVWLPIDAKFPADSYSRLVDAYELGDVAAIEEAAKDLGVRTCLCYEISDRDGMEKSRESVMENVNFIRHVQKEDSDMLAAMMGMHASFTISDETMELCNELKPEGVGYHIHVAEGIYDLHQCLKEHGKRIVDRLYDWNILGPKTLLGHCIYINEHEMELIRETDTMVVHNPESNMGNACGCPPTMELVHKGILTGLGTDGYTHDMMESWKVANILHKHHLCDPTAAWSEVPQMLFDGNAKIANRYFKKTLGILKEGAAADVIVVDYDPLTPMDASNCNGHLLFGVNGSMVQTTVCSGKVLMKDRELLVCDEKKIMADCRQAARELSEDING